MAGAPAHSAGCEPGSSDDGATPATGEGGLQMSLRPQVIGGPACRATGDDDPLRGNPRDAGDLSER
eukprot:1876835-Pyramimonas_sp.AAC.1